MGDDAYRLAVEDLSVTDAARLLASSGSFDALLRRSGAERESQSTSTLTANEVDLKLHPSGIVPILQVRYASASVAQRQAERGGHVWLGM